MSFRNKILSRWPIGVIDIIGHFAWAFLLPGKWWMQFLPDTFILHVLFRSWWTNKLLPEDNEWLSLHKWLHTVWPVIILATACLYFDNKVFGVMGIQWVAHVIWDTLTHPEQEFKKGLLWIR